MRRSRLASGEYAGAMLGGHVDAVPVSVGSGLPRMKTGKVRVIAVTSPERLPGDYAEIPA